MRRMAHAVVRRFAFEKGGTRMRRTVWALLLCLLAVSAGLVWYPYLSAERVSTPFEAAELLQQAYFLYKTRDYLGNSKPI